LMQIAVSQLPTNKLAAYIRGRRDEQLAVESLIQAMQVDGTLDIATGHMIMGYLATLDRRPKVEA
jgi:hypothetical protein